MLLFFVLHFIHITQSTILNYDMGSSAEFCSLLKIQVLAFDFDKTCTRDLVLDIYKAREDYHGEFKGKLDKEWDGLKQFYINNAKKVVFPMLEATEPLPAMFDEQGLRDFLRKWEEVDILVMNEVITSRILKGITKNGIKEFAESVELMPDVLEVLESFKMLNKSLHVISLNFSQKLIEDVLNRNGTLPLAVHTNKLTFENEISTGTMDKTFLSAFDKEVEFQRIVGNSNEAMCAGIAIYIGDSYNDVLALLEADVGFIIGNSKSMLQICHNFGIQVVQYKWNSVQTWLNSKKVQPVLFSVKSWEEVKDFILSTLEKSEIRKVED